MSELVIVSKGDLFPEVDATGRPLRHPDVAETLLDVVRPPPGQTRSGTRRPTAVPASISPTTAEVTGWLKR